MRSQRTFYTVGNCHHLDDLFLDDWLKTILALKPSASESGVTEIWRRPRPPPFYWFTGHWRDLGNETADTNRLSSTRGNSNKIVMKLAKCINKTIFICDLKIPFQRHLEICGFEGRRIKLQWENSRVRIFWKTWPSEKQFLRQTGPKIVWVGLFLNHRTEFEFHDVRYNTWK